MQKAQLEKQLKEVRALREQLGQNPQKMESPFKNKGLRVVAEPSAKKDASVIEFKKRQQKRELKFQTKLGSKLQGFKVA